MKLPVFPLFLLTLSLSIFADTAPLQEKNEPFIAEEFCYLADHFNEIGKREKAIELYKKALSHQPNNPHAQAKLGAIYYDQNSTDQAIECYRNALSLQHNEAHIYYNLGLCYMKRSEWKDAAEAFKQAVELEPQHQQAHLHLGLVQEKLSQFDIAISAYEKAAELNPDSFEAHHHLGNALRHVERLEEAVEPYRNASRIQPNNIHVLMDLANALNMLNYNEESLELYKKIVEISPNAISALYNFGFTLKKIDRLEEAMKVYEQVLTKKPDYAPVHFSLSSIYLALGNFEKGWPEYEWRWKTYNEQPKKYNRPLWNGEDLHGKTLLIYAEQGLGDTLQFIRYIKELKKQYPTAQFIFETQKPLTQLLKLQPYIDTVIARNEQAPSCDYHIPLMTLPCVLKTDLHTIPADIPYIIPDSNRVTYWKEQLPKDTNFKIGICWQGNARYSTQALRRAVASKSIDLELFKPLAEIAGVSLYVLQRIDGMEQIEQCSFKDKLILFGPEFDTAYGSFMDSAAIIPQLDLIISVDTGVCHLAGALGIPTWVPLPKPADWRWLRNRDDSPWYPSIRLFRQEKIGDWQPVMTRITQAVTECMQNASTKQLSSTEYFGSKPTCEQEQYFDQLIKKIE